LQQRLDLGGFGRTKEQIAQAVTDRPATRVRISAARAGLPAARSSITRSTMDLAKVTP
jgi:hypothetical protein